LRVLGIIPARGGSKGIPGKNIKPLGGKPVIKYTIESAQESKLLTEIFVSTDDPEIAEVAENSGIKVPFLRPSKFALDNSPSIDVIIHALNELDKLGKQYDAVCLLQPTSPFREFGFIDKCIEKFEKSSADSLISVLQVPHQFNPHWIFEENEFGSLSISTGENQIIPRRQELPKAYYRDGSVYLTKVEIIRNERKLLYGNIQFVESNELYYCNLDTMEDWNLAEQRVCEYNLNLN
jgi:CMP-N,N'-diacetyllegionaminic acid synthase